VPIDNALHYSVLQLTKTFLSLRVQKLNRPQLEYMELDAYEQRILTDGLVDVDETNVTFKDIGGLEKELEEVKVSLA
jgi:hypothetical protein